LLVGENYYGDMGLVHEWFGYSPDDQSHEARLAVEEQCCPFVGGLCRKRKSGGVCSIRPTASNVPVVICPARLYSNEHMFLKQIAQDAFANHEPSVGEDGLPRLVRGSQALVAASEAGSVQVGVFGQGWDSEVRLPPSTEGGAQYSVDFTLIATSPEGDLLGFVPVEVQTIDTTDSNADAVKAMSKDRSDSKTKAGLNWENVSKRILPQLIVKGLMLQGEARCTKGIYFVTPDAVFDKIARRLGGMDRLREIPQQPGSITFIRYAYSKVGTEEGVPMELEVVGRTTISTSDMSIAFISPQNLPAAGAYEEILRWKMKPSAKPRRQTTAIGAISGPPSVSLEAELDFPEGSITAGP
jgi:hypothetical protein